MAIAMSSRSSYDLAAVLGVFRRQASVVVLAMVFFAGAAYAYSSTRPDEYDARAALLFRPLQLDAQVTGLPLQVPGDADRDAATNLALVSLDAVRVRAAQQLGPGYTADGLEDRVKASADGQSSIITITATGREPAEAARVANAVATQFVAIRRDALRSQLQSASDGVRAELRRSADAPRATRIALRRNISRLELLRSVQTGDASIAQAARAPTKRSSPQPLRDALIGAFAGLLVGLAAALAIEQLDRRLRRVGDTEELLGAPLLGAIPRSRSLGRRRAGRALPAGEAEAFRRLRANVRYRETSGSSKSLLVTSTSADSGKTTVALNLARTAAAAGARVLLVEADLHRPTLASTLQLDGPGLAGYLRDQDGDDLTPPTRSIASDGLPPTARLDALPAGSANGDAAELLERPRLEELLNRASELYDLVVVDGPPYGLVADAVPLARLTDGALVVARVGADSRDDLERMGSELSDFGVRVIGVVANFAPQRTEVYGGS